MQYSLCTECDGRLWAVESKESGVCAECRMDDDCDIRDLEDMFEEVLK
jgi:hypothetical protein